MAELAVPPSSRTLVKKAGNVLAKRIPLWQTEAEKTAVVDSFKVAHQWRRAHLVPLMSVREVLRHRAKQQQEDAIVVGRLKRMSSIRRKLPSRSLHQIQDIAGCRAIFTTMKNAEAVIEALRSGHCKHELISGSDYITKPKRDGYRSHHLVLSFCGDDRTEAYNGLKTEIQIRTQMQHAWATAVEAVGLYLNQDLKFRSGDERWLRLFQLMASEIAEAENLPVVAESSSNQDERRREIKNLNRELKALMTLENFRNAIKDTENFWKPQTKYYLIQYDNIARTVVVKPFIDAAAGSAYYDFEEEKKMIPRTPFLSR